MEAMDTFKCAALGIMKINDQVDEQVVDLVSHAAVVVEATPLGEFLTKELPSPDNSSLSSCGSSPVAAPIDDRPATALYAPPAKAETKKPPPTLAEVLDSEKLRPVTKRPKPPSKLSDRLSKMGGRGPGGVSSRLLSKVGRPDPLPRPATVTPRRRDPPRQVEVAAAPTRRREARAIQLNDTRKNPSRGETDSGSNVSAVSSTAKASRMTPTEIQAAMAKAAAEVQRMLGQLLSWNIMRVADQRVPELEIRHDKLPAYFKSMDVFQKAFRPLVLDECRCGIVNDTIATQLEPFPVKILSSTKMTEWLSVNILSNKKSQDFLQSTLQSGVTVVDVNQANRNELERLPFRPMDLLLLIPGPGTDINGRRFAQVKQPPSDGYLLAFVDKSDDTDRKLKTWRQNQVATLKMLSAPPDAGHQGRISPTRLAVSSQWSAYQISSLVTSVREFEAMYMARFSVLFPYILNPKTSSMEITSTFGEHRSKFKHMAKLSNLNGSQVGVFNCMTLMLLQANALEHALSCRSGVALLQGPPGTGKTKSLLCLLSMMYEMVAKKSGGGPLKKKILVCAPSNAAVDEIAARVITVGLVNAASDGSALPPRRPNLLRVGNPNKITQESVKEISYEMGIAKEFKEEDQRRRDYFQNRRGEIAARLDTIEEEIKVDKEFREAQQQAATMGFGTWDVSAANKNDSAKTQTLYNERRQLHEERSKLNGQFESSRSTHQANTREQALQGADILFCTLSGSGNESLIGVDFEALIIDEAAQAVELSSLIPLRHQISRMILIGDPRQLPATVLSNVAKSRKYDRSLFERLMLNGAEVVMMNMQYRMRPEISFFPSAHFYAGRLQDDATVRNRKPMSFHSFPMLFAPFKFFHIPSVEEREPMFQSVKNVTEAKFIVHLVRRLLRSFRASSNSDFDLGDLSVVTPYRAQLNALRQEFKQFPEFQPDEPEICTIDAFQGREKKIIIFSCVRASAQQRDAGPDPDSDFTIPEHDGKDSKSDSQSTLGFVADVRRLNVAITRARDALWIVGNATTLRASPSWKAMIDYARYKNLKLVEELTADRGHLGSLDCLRKLMGKPFVDVVRSVAEARAGFAGSWPLAPTVQDTERSLRSVPANTILREFFDISETLGTPSAPLSAAQSPLARKPASGYERDPASAARPKMVQRPPMLQPVLLGRPAPPGNSRNLVQAARSRLSQATPAPVVRPPPCPPPEVQPARLPDLESPRMVTPRVYPRPADTIPSGVACGQTPSRPPSVKAMPPPPWEVRRSIQANSTFPSEAFHEAQGTPAKKRMGSPFDDTGKRTRLD
ncbi:MAG: hypothetical protein KVP17_003964 [Porospora cf. gigantea B]|nr:MAG: hypothetical protein KVP17_003964 [Porospora cf. gigantea B]